MGRTPMRTTVARGFIRTVAPITAQIAPEAPKDEKGVL